MVLIDNPLPGCIIAAKLYWVFGDDLNDMIAMKKILCVPGQRIYRYSSKDPCKT